MSSSACWMEKCPCCNGQCKLQVWDKKGKKMLPAEDCMVCDARGYIMVKKTVTKKKD